jgi:hypothetical protein
VHGALIHHRGHSSGNTAAQPFSHRHDDHAAVRFRQQTGGHQGLSGRKARGHVQAAKEAVVINVNGQAPLGCAVSQRFAQTVKPFIALRAGAYSQAGAAQAKGIYSEQIERKLR